MIQKATHLSKVPFTNSASLFWSTAKVFSADRKKASVTAIQQRPAICTQIKIISRVFLTDSIIIKRVKNREN